jgi:uroporphyrin-III C-methyltransferase/precorrin-2 dehydrogenase/sirohydrochlorin ferrochelatase/uroporphyrin-III C-methyltransferase
VDAKVFIIGAGPGDPDLLTMKAHRLLQRADVVVYDRLVSSDVLDLVPTGATRIFAGKAAGRHTMPQGEINELLLSLAQSGRRVVRLKGGDPFVFGRGSEEALHLARHGVPFEIVPGITAAAGCAAYAGIPLTHRDIAKGVQFITGHDRNGKELDVDWQSLADPETTLVIYMGLGNAPRISRELIAAGLPGTTPAAAIENGTTPEQRVRLTTLADLPEAVADLTAPTLLIVGEVVDLAKDLGWRVEDEPAGQKLSA